MSFKSLVSAVSEQCQEIKQSLASFPYFETWEPDVIAECCRLSSVMEFPPDRIILGPEAKTSHTVYFMLEGVSRMIRNLHVEVRKNSRGKPVYKLYRFSDSKTTNPESTNEGFSSRLFNREYFCQQKKKVADEKTEKSEVSEETKSPDVWIPEPEEDSNEIADKTSTKITEENQAPSIPNVVETTEELENEPIDEPKLEESKNEPMDEPKLEESEKETPDAQKNSKESIQTTQDEEKDVKSETEEAEDAKESKPIFEPDLHLKILEECRKKREETIWVSAKGTVPEKPKNVESIFVQVGFLHKGACFGLEKSETFIVSATKVKCLKIPRRFLFQHNRCYVWNRISLFHSLHLPKDETIFERFQTDRRWNERKKKLSEDVVSLKTIPNYTLISEVPYSIRLAEMR